MLSTCLAQKQDSGSHGGQSDAPGSGSAGVSLGLCLKNSAWWDGVSTLLSIVDALAGYVGDGILLCFPLESGVGYNPWECF